MNKKLLIIPVLALLFAGLLASPASAIIWQEDEVLATEQEKSEQENRQCVVIRKNPESRAIVINGVDTDRPYLGVHLEPDEEGVVIHKVEPGSAAEKAGLLEGDRILSIDGTTVTSPDQLTKAIGDHSPGGSIALGVEREGETLELTAELGSRESFSFYGPHRRGMRWMDEEDALVRPPVLHNLKGNWTGNRWYMGIQYAELNADLASYFSVKADEGLLVTEVSSESPAAEAGLKAGDVLRTVNGRTIADAADLQNALRIRDEARTAIPVEIIRRTEAMSLSLPAEKRPGPMQFQFRDGKDIRSLRVMPRIRQNMERLQKRLHVNGRILERLQDGSFFDADPVGPMNFNFKKGEASISFSLDEDGSVTFNGRSFDDLKAFRQFTQSDEFERMIQEFREEIEESLREEIEIAVDTEAVITS